MSWPPPINAAKQTPRVLPRPSIPKQSTPVENPTTPIPPAEANGPSKRSSDKTPALSATPALSTTAALSTTPAPSTTTAQPTTPAVGGTSFVDETLDRKEGALNRFMALNKDLSRAKAFLYLHDADWSVYGAWRKSMEDEAARETEP